MHKRKKSGFSLIECLISVFLLVIMLTGGMAFYFHSNQFFQSAVHRRIASEIANSVMETIKTQGLGGLPASENITIGNLTGIKTIYNVTSYFSTDYKMVSVDIAWNEPGSTLPRQVRLVSYFPE